MKRAWGVCEGWVPSLGKVWQTAEPKGPEGFYGKLGVGQVGVNGQVLHTLLLSSVHPAGQSSAGCCGKEDLSLQVPKVRNLG